MGAGVRKKGSSKVSENKSDGTDFGTELRHSFLRAIEEFESRLSARLDQTEARIAATFERFETKLLKTFQNQVSRAATRTKALEIRLNELELEVAELRTRLGLSSTPGQTH